MITNKEIEEGIMQQNALVARICDELLIPFCDEMNLRFNNQFEVNGSELWCFHFNDEEDGDDHFTADDRFDETCDWLTQDQRKRFNELLNILSMELGVLSIGCFIKSYNGKKNDSTI